VNGNMTFFFRGWMGICWWYETRIVKKKYRKNQGLSNWI